MHRNIFPAASKIAMPLPRIFTAILLILLSANPVQGDTKTSNVNKQYIKKDQFRIITPSAPKTFQIYHTFTYDKITREYTYTTWSYDPYEGDYNVHDTHSTRAAAKSAKPSGGKITVSSSVVDKKTGLRGTEVASSCSIQKASISPEKIAEYAKQQLKDSEDAMEESEVKEIVDADNAAESEETCDPEPVEEGHDRTAAEAEEEAEEEEKSFFARAFGDPVQLSSGSLLLTEEDLRIPLPGDAPDFRLSRTYRSADVHSGPRGRHWFGSLESRLIRCNSLPFWTSPELCRQEILRLQTVLTELEEAAKQEKHELETSLPGLLESAQELERASAEYLSKSRKANSAGKTGYKKLSRRCATRAEQFRTQISLIQNRIDRLFGEILPAERQKIRDQIFLLEEREEQSEKLSLRRAAMTRLTEEMYISAGPVPSGSRERRIQNIGRSAGLATILWITPSGGLRSFTLTSPEQTEEQTAEQTSDLHIRNGGLPDDGLLPGSALIYRCRTLPLHRLELGPNGSMRMYLPGNFRCDYDTRGRFLKKYRLLPPHNPMLLYEYRYEAKDGKPGYVPDRIILQGERRLNLEWKKQGGYSLLQAVRFSFPEMEERQIRFAYSPEGYLQNVNYPDGSMKEYCWDGRLSSTTQKHGEGSPDIHKTYSYDQDGRVTAVRDNRGFSEEFSYFLRTGTDDYSVARARYGYDPGNTPGSTAENSGPYGLPGTLEYEFDPHGRISLSRKFDSRGTLNEIRKKEYVPGAPGLLYRELITTFHPNTNGPGLLPAKTKEEAVFAYYQKAPHTGLLKSITRSSDDPRRPSGTFSFAYNDQGYLTESRDPDGVTLRYSYNPAGLLQEILRSDGGRRRYHYDSRGLCTSFTDEEGNSWQYGRDQFGNRSRITDPLGNSYVFQFDALGRCLAGEDPLGGDLTAVDFYREIIPPPDPRSLIPDDRSAHGANRIGRYTPAGRSAEYLPSLARTDEPVLISRDECGRVERIDYPGSADTLIRYDRCGRITSITDRNGGSTSFAYDPCGRIISITGPLGSRSEYLRDARGRVTRITENICREWPEGLIQRELQYDTKGMLTGIVYPDGSSEQFIHDNQGRITSRRDRWGRIHRITRIEAPGSQAIAIEGETAGGRAIKGEGGAQSIEARGETCINYESPGTYRREVYDSRLRLKAVYAGPDSSRLHLLSDLRYSPDGLSRVSRAGGLNSWQTYAEPETGLKRIVDPDGREQLSRFDDAGKIISLQRGEMLRSYQRDPDGRITQDKGEYPLRSEGSAPITIRREIQYRLDYLGRIVREEHSMGGVSSYSYRGGKLIRSTHSDGRDLQYRWNPAGQLLQVEDAGGTALKTIEYDPAGRIVKAGVPGESLEFLWDREDRLLEATSGGIGLDSRLQWTRGSLPASISLTHGDTNPQASLLPSCEYEYDEADRIIGISLKSNTGGTANMKLQIRRDGLGRITSIWKRTGNSPELLQQISYTRDGCMESDLFHSRRNPLHPSGGNIYSYTPGRKLSSSVGADGGLSIYSYDPSGKLTSALTPQPGGSSQNTRAPELVWAGPDPDQRQTLGKLWDARNLPSRFSPYQQLEKQNLTPEATNIQEDTFGRLVQWETEGRRYRASYNRFSRLEQLDVRNSLAETTIAYEYDAMNRLRLRRELYRRVSPDRESRPLEDETLRLTRFAYMGTSSRVLASAHYSSERTYLQGPAIDQDGDSGDGSFPEVPEHPPGEGYRSSSPRSPSSTSHDDPGMAGSEENLLTPRAICMYHWVDGKITALSVARTRRPGTDPSDPKEGSYNQTDDRFRASGPHSREPSPGATQSLSHYYLPDSMNGSKPAIVDLQNLSAGMIHYEVYGKPHYPDSQTPGNPLRELSSLGICVPGFAGKCYNPYSGLINFGYRFYMPSAGRFLTPDPLRTGYSWTAYCDDDPVNFTDSLGLQKSGFIHYDVDEERFWGFTCDDEEDNLDDVNFFDVYTTNNLRDREYPTQTGEKLADPVTTILENKERGSAYYPEHFPRGGFNITKVKEKKNPKFGPYFIATDATIEVETHQYDPDLKDWTPRMDESGNLLTETDAGYGFHAGGDIENFNDPNNPDATTKGCGRHSTSDNIMLAMLFKEVLDDGGTVEGCAK